MFLKSLGCIGAVIIILSGIWLVVSLANPYKISEEQTLMYSITREAGKILEKRHGMHQSSIGSAKQEFIERAILSFQIRKNLTKNECRKLLIDCAETLIEAFNANKEIQPYISHPFNSKNIKLSIFLSDENGYDLFFPSYSVVGVYENRLRYCTESKEKEFGYCTQEKESYEEALEIIQQQELKLRSESIKD